MHDLNTGEDVLAVHPDEMTYHGLEDKHHGTY